MSIWSENIANPANSYVHFVTSPFSHQEKTHDFQTRPYQRPATGRPAPAGLTHVGPTFDIVATYTSSGEPAQPEPDHSHTLSVQYPGSFPALEDMLALYFWDGNQWVQEPTSLLDPSANTITAAPDHFSTWTVMGRGRSMYLPILMH
jgi:hypothetical protein